MNKKVLILTGLFLALVVFVVFSLFSGPKGTLIFNAKDYYLPYTVKFPGQVTIELPCTEAECVTNLETGDYNFYIEKEGYFVQEGSVAVTKGEPTYFDVALEVVPGLTESSGGIDESVFEKCYGDSVECGNSEFSMTADEETGYMALWQDDNRRATFTKGMNESLIFSNGNTAIVYDVTSGDAYLVDFEKDSRDFAFNLSDLIELMFLDNGEYLARTGNGIFWIKNDGSFSLHFGRDLNSVAYENGKIYFIGDGTIMSELITAEGAFVGSYDGTNYYVITDGLDVDPDSAVMGSDEDGIYVKDGEKEYEIRT